MIDFGKQDEKSSEIHQQKLYLESQLVCHLDLVLDRSEGGLRWESEAQREPTDKEDGG
jgi:hypothetical protein